MKLFAFDFDKTITISDTILPLSRYLSNKLNVPLKFRYIQFYYILFRLGIIGSRRFKSKIVSILLRNQNVNSIEKYVADFFQSRFNELFNSQIIELIQKEKNNANHIIVITSNLSLYVNPVKKILNIDEVFGTKVKLKENNLADSIEGENCSGKIKAKILAEYNSRYNFEKVISYGDSTADYEMLRISDEGFLANYQFQNLFKKFLYRISNINGKLYNKGFNIKFNKFHY